MAIVVTGGVALAANKTAEASTTTTTVSSTCAAGDLVLVAIAADNAGTSGVSAISSVTDSTGANTYTQVALRNRTAGATNDGLTIAIYQSVLASALTSGVGTITVNWSPNVAAKVISVNQVTGADTTAYATDANSGSGTTYTSNASPSMASGDLYFGAVGNESNTAPVADSDTTNGSWLTVTGGGTGGSGGDATKMALYATRKIVTGAGSQTLDGSTGANTDWALVAALYTVPAVAAERVPFYRPMTQLLGH